MTLTPMLCSRFLRSPHEQRRSWFYRVTERFFDAHAARPTTAACSGCCAIARATMMFSPLVLVATVFMFVKIPKGFIPDQDTDQIFAVTEAAQGTSYYQMVEYQKQIAEVIRRDPNVEALVSTVGGTGPRPWAAPISARSWCI